MVRLIFTVIILKVIHNYSMEILIMNEYILAVKSNPDPTVIKILAALNTSFDCASMVRMKFIYFIYFKFNIVIYKIIKFIIAA